VNEHGTPPTHFLGTSEGSDGPVGYPARVGYCGKYESGEEFLFLDLFRVHFDSGKLKAWNETKTESKTVNASSLGWAFQDCNNLFNVVKRINDVDVGCLCLTPVFTDDQELKARVYNSNIECPALLFVYIPERNTELYNLVKLYTNIDRGIQVRRQGLAIACSLSHFLTKACLFETPVSSIDQGNL
jgi:hypothetical protein